MPLRQLSLKHSSRSRQLQIVSTRLVSNAFSGTYKSVFRGRGVLFEDLCDYQPGDDIRNIDWNVTARTGRPYIKRFAEEREMTVMILLDRSASLFCPTPRRPKHEAAESVSALLAIVADRNNDRVGLITFGNGIECYVPPGKGFRHVQRLISEITDTPNEPGGSDLVGALNYLNCVTRRPVTLFIVSDFICGDFRVSLASVARRHDTVAIVICDSHDMNIPDVGLLQVADAETGVRRVIDTSSQAVRNEYTRLATGRMTEISKTISAAGAKMVSLDTTANPVHVLSRFFQARQRRARRLA
jgi:uncharacterized protein (DUF58 family)